MEVPGEKSRTILEGLGFRVEPAESGGHRVTIPSWRGDVQHEADLIEEVGRHFGLDQIPSTVPPARRRGALRPSLLRARRVREILTGAGLVEVVRLSFVGQGFQAQPGVAIANPLADVEGLLRVSLVDPGLIDTLRQNLSHNQREVRIFELGRVFLPRGPAIEERTQLGILLSGSARPRHWSERPRGVDFFDAVGLIELLGARLGLGFAVAAGAVPPFVHPGKSAVLSWGGEALGYVGALHPEVSSRDGLREEVLVIELRLDTVLEAGIEDVHVVPLPRHPGASRDLSVLVDRGVSAQQLTTWAQVAAGPLLQWVKVTDRYEGPPVPEGKVSLTLSLRYQERERTLTSEEVQASVEGVAHALRTRGAEIRGE